MQHDITQSTTCACATGSRDLKNLNPLKACPTCLPLTLSTIIYTKALMIVTGNWKLDWDRVRVTTTNEQNKEMNETVNSLLYVPHFAEFNLSLLDSHDSVSTWKIKLSKIIKGIRISLKFIVWFASMIAYVQAQRLSGESTVALGPEFIVQMKSSNLNVSIKHTFTLTLFCHPTHPQPELAPTHFLFSSHSFLIVACPVSRLNHWS